jgi:hypothetical protein
LPGKISCKQVNFQPVSGVFQELMLSPNNPQTLPATKPEKKCLQRHLYKDIALKSKNKYPVSGISPFSPRILSLPARP